MGIGFYFYHIGFTMCSGIYTLIGSLFWDLRFESSVILYGSQAQSHVPRLVCLFESSVILYGSQAFPDADLSVLSFESSVILYGSQALR